MNKLFATLSFLALTFFSTVTLSEDWGEFPDQYNDTELEPEEGDYDEQEPDEDPGFQEYNNSTDDSFGDDDRFNDSGASDLPEDEEEEEEYDEDYDDDDYDEPDDGEDSGLYMNETGY